MMKRAFRAHCLIGVTLWLLISETFSSDSSIVCSTITDEIGSVVDQADLSNARSLALTGIRRSPECKEAVVEAYKKASNNFLSTSDFPEKINAALKESSRTAMQRPVAKQDAPNCLPNAVGSFGDPTKEWDQCCSILPKPSKADSFSFEPASDCVFDNPCCEFFPQSRTHLRLPALHEPAIRVRVALENRTTTLNLEQDGYLRPYDISAILWPSGYLLTQCLANPTKGQLPELQQAIDKHPESALPIALELGTGVGAGSVSLALHLQENLGRAYEEPVVLATDIAPHALALAAANAHGNHVNVGIQQLNHTNLTSVTEAKTVKFANGVAVVLGSSLQAIFHETSQPESALWKVLDILLDSKNDEAVAVLVHTKTERLLPPDSGEFIVTRRIGGEEFEMDTRTGDPSDFEISVFKRNYRHFSNEL